MRNKYKKKTRKKKGAGKNLSKPKQKEVEEEKQLNPYLLDIIRRYNTEIYETIFNSVREHRLFSNTDDGYGAKLISAKSAVEAVQPTDPREEHLDHLFALKTMNYLGSRWVNYQAWDREMPRGWMRAQNGFWNPTSLWYITFVYEPILDYEQIWGMRKITKEKIDEVISRLITLSDPYHPLRYTFLLLAQQGAPQVDFFNVEAEREHGWLPLISQYIQWKSKERIIKQYKRISSSVLSSLKIKGNADICEYYSYDPRDGKSWNPYYYDEIKSFIVDYYSGDKWNQLPQDTQNSGTAYGYLSFNREKFKYPFLDKEEYVNRRPGDPSKDMAKYYCEKIFSNKKKEIKNPHRQMENALNDLVNQPGPSIKKYRDDYVNTLVKPSAPTAEEIRKAAKDSNCQNKKLLELGKRQQKLIENQRKSLEMCEKSKEKWKKKHMKLTIKHNNIKELFLETVSDFNESYTNFKQAVEDGFFEKLTSLYDDNHWDWQEDPVTMDTIVDPIMIDDGHVYSRQTLIDWRNRINTQNQNRDDDQQLPFTSPRTGANLNNRYLRDNVLENLPRIIQFSQALEQLTPLKQLLQDPKILNEEGNVSMVNESYNTNIGIINDLSNYMKDAVIRLRNIKTQFNRIKIDFLQDIHPMMQSTMNDDESKDDSVSRKKGGKRRKTRKKIRRKKRNTRK